MSVDLYGPGSIVYQSGGNEALLGMIRNLSQLIDNLTNGQYAPADESVTDEKVAPNAAIAQSKIAGLVADLAARATDAELAALDAAVTAALLLKAPSTGIAQAAITNLVDDLAAKATPAEITAAIAALSGTYAETAQLPVDLKAVYGVSAAATATANTAAINQAITDANTAYVAGLGIRRLKLPPERGIRITRAGSGTSYAINAGKSGFELYGDGEGRTELLVDSFNFDDAASYYQSIFHIKGASSAALLTDIYLHDFSVDGNRAAMTGTPHANAGDTFDTKWCASSVVMERLTVRNSSSDAFDIDDSTGSIVRFCSAYNASGWGFHNSENNIGTVMLGNYAEGCGFGLNRGGIDQFLTASKSTYFGNRMKDNYQNFGIVGADATFFGNVDLGGATVANEMTGVIAGVDPVDGKMMLHGATTGLRLGDQADLASGKRWLLSVANGILGVFSNTLGANALTVHNNGNVGIGSVAAGGGTRVLSLGDATAVPSSNPSSGAVIYSEGGVLKSRSPAGVVASLVPPVPTVEIGEVEEAFRPTGLIFERFSRRDPNFLNIAPLNTGRLSLYAHYLPAGAVVGSLAFYSSTTAAVSPTNQWFAIYNVATLALIRQTVDDLTTAWPAATRKSLNLSSSWTVPTSGLYYFGIMVAAATVPTLLGKGTAAAVHVTGMAPIISGAANTALTTTAPATAVISTATTPIPYFTGS